jgi:hypothetical protein
MIETHKISLISKISQADGNVVSDMDGEKVMLSIRNGNYYNLGKLGGDIWDLIKLPTEINNVIDSLLSEYQVEKAVCEEQVLSFIEQLHNEGLIIIDNHIG